MAKCKTALMIAALLLVMTGCGSFGGPDSEVESDFTEGRIFTYMRVPFTRNLNNTPSPEFEGGKKRIIHIKEPFSGAGIYAEFNSNAIADIAKERGLKRFYFADLEVFDILGIFSYRKLILYGE